MKQKVLLVGGPFDQSWREVDPGRKELTITTVSLESYRRVNDTRFEHCPTQTAIGGTGLAWWDSEE
jgi:hypothetical protein